MSVRILAGSFDGASPAAVLADSTTGWPVGTIFTGADAAEQAQAFLDWIGGYQFVPVVEDAALAASEIPDPRTDASDPRAWPPAGLRKLQVYWRARYLTSYGCLDIVKASPA